MTNEQKSFHKSRRELLRQLLGKDSLAIVFGSTHFNKSYDGDFRFKQFKNFYYLTGFEEAESVILLSQTGIGTEKHKEILFVQKKDKLAETWGGKRMGHENSKARLGISRALENTELESFLTLHNLRKLRRIYVNISELIKLTGESGQYAYRFLKSLNRIAPHAEVIDIAYAIGVMRSLKTTYELKMMARAADISVRAYYAAMKAISPGKHEHEIQAELEYHYKVYGSEDNAYYPIVASGENGCILHYDSNNCKLEDGDLLLIDSAGEHRYYCSDITRTFPVNGRFTKEQRTVYDIVLKANMETIKRAKAGVSFSSLGELSNRIIANGLHNAGILKNKDKIRKYTLHGLGHHIGLDTHDAVPYLKTSESDMDKLREGNVVTIEPGVYFPFGSEDIPKKYHGIAVRIEDDIVITKDGNVNLTEHMIKDADEIEAVMNEDK